MTSTLPLTGERTVPGVPVENYWFQRHVAAYDLVATRCRGRDVLDTGCGEGYGVEALRDVARSVTGIELDEAVVAHARATYPAATFLRADICDTGLPDASADVVVNLQVIEHLPDVGRFLGEVRRVLRPGGELIVATPNRLTFTPHSHEPTNIFHVEEFSPEELRSRLADVGGFEVTRLLGLHHDGLVAAAEVHTHQPFTDLVLQSVERWPAWLHARVRSVDPWRDFTWREDDLDASLDLLAICRR